MTTKYKNLTAIENSLGWSVIDENGGRWWPDAEAAEKIEASDDPAETAIEMVLFGSAHGQWVD